MKKNCQHSKIKFIIEMNQIYSFISDQKIKKKQIPIISEL